MIHRFDDFELNELSRELKRDGEPIAIEPKVFDLLHILIQSSHRVLSRELLFAELWPGVCVSEASLSRLVKEARRAIGDDGERQSMIRTVRGSGYRFVGPLAAVPRSELAGEAEIRIERARRRIEAVLHRGSLELRGHVEDFVTSCEIAIAAARDESRSE